MIGCVAAGHDRQRAAGDAFDRAAFQLGQVLQQNAAHFEHRRRMRVDRRVVGGHRDLARGVVDVGACRATPRRRLRPTSLDSHQSFGTTPTML